MEGKQNENTASIVREKNGLQHVYELVQKTMSVIYPAISEQFSCVRTGPENNVCHLPSH